MTTYGRRERVARKLHECSCCAAPIPAGSRYVRWVSHDDVIVTSKAHPECEQWLSDLHYDTFDVDEWRQFRHDVEVYAGVVNPSTLPWNR
jgi:hypothetical protein